MDSEDVTAVLLNYKRQSALCEVIRSLGESMTSVPITEIIVVNNSPVKFVPPRVSCASVSVIEMGTNYGTSSRIAGVKNATNKNIYTQDDDCIVKNKYELFSSYCADVNHRSVVLNHTDEADSMKKGRLSSCLGNGSFFSQLSAIDFDDRYRRKYKKNRLYYLHWDWLFTGFHDRVKRVDVLIQKDKIKKRCEVDRIRDKKGSFFEFYASAMRRMNHYRAEFNDCESIIEKEKEWTGLKT